jgi:hypothetical protein
MPIPDKIEAIFIWNWHDSVPADMNRVDCPHLEGRGYRNAMKEEVTETPCPA